MPGFFINFLILTLAWALCRWFATHRGPSWLLWVPAPGATLWLLTFVYAAATLSAPIDADADGSLQARSLQLFRVHRAGQVGVWIAFATAGISGLLCAWAALRPTPLDQPREPHQQP